MKTLSIFLSLINSLLAGVILLASLTGSEIRQAAFLWLFTKLFVTLIIIAIGVLTWLGSMFTLKPTLMALSSLFLVALGAATVVWTFHLAMVTGDMEYYMVVYGGSLAMQGAASLFGFADESRNLTATS
jgi:hypothetical protein